MPSQRPDVWFDWEPQDRIGATLGVEKRCWLPDDNKGECWARDSTNGRTVGPHLVVEICPTAKRK